MRVNRAQKATPVTVPAPVGGWNARDSLDSMSPEDAVTLDNWFPGFGKVSTRDGTEAYATGLEATVKMVAEFNAGSLRKMIAAANGKIWDVSSSGAATSLATGFTSDIWETAQFDDSGGGARMGLVNGADAPRTYNGSAIAAMTVSGTGLTTSTLNGIHIHKNRSYFWDDRKQDFWYSGVDALGGALTKFPLGRVQGTGGNLMAMGTWSHDAGSGLDDYAAFILSSGDVLVYQGSDPSSAVDWGLVGRYNIGAPISKRAIKKIASELLIVTKAGYIPISSMVKGGRYNDKAASISSKIRLAATEAARLYGSQFGWDVLHYPARNMLIINTPFGGTRFRQHVMNTETKAWCRFTEIDAQCWALYNDVPYFGTANGTVLKFSPTATSDSGTAITAESQNAWTYLADRRHSKRATAIRFTYSTIGSVASVYFGIGFDFKDIRLSSYSEAATGSSASSWDEADWDTSDWADESVIHNGWYSATGGGYAIGSRFKAVAAASRTDWYSTTYLVEQGGVL